MSEIAIALTDLLHEDDPDLQSLRSFAKEQHQENGKVLDETIRAMMEVLTNDHELLAWMWDAMGLEILSELLTPRIKHKTGTFQRQRSASLPAVRPSWRDRLKHTPDGIWALVVPVGNTGRTKCLGDFDWNDMADVESAYRDTAKKMVSRAEYCSRIRRDMRPGDTLREMAHEGRLHANHLQFIDSRLDEIGGIEILPEEETDA